jgi:hypothetical protein
MTPQQVAADVAKLVHAQTPWEAANLVADFSRISLKFHYDTKPEKYLPILQNFVHVLMDSGDMAGAASILWTPNQFTPEPESVKQVWKLFDESSQGLIMGAASMGKSFSFGVRLFLEWMRDPVWTSVRCVGPSEDHLEQNLFSHLVGLHGNSTLPMPGSVGDLFIGTNRRNQLGSIRGVVIPKSNTKKAGRLQGGHRKPRTAPHPTFGPLSRMFIFIDEVENVPQGIWHDVDNVLSEISGDGGFKIFGAYNPSDLSLEVAKRAEPPYGWQSLDEDSHHRWVSIRGWDVLRLDAEKCENVVQGKVIYPGLQSRTGLEAIAKSSGGRQSAHYLTMGRGSYPKQGTELTVIPPGMLASWRGEFIWLENPQPVGGSDLALEGGDPCIYTLGMWGLASGVRLPASLEFPEGKVIMFKNPRGGVMPRWGLQANQQFEFPKGDTAAMTAKHIDFNKKAGVRPEYFSCDRTGHGAGVADMIKHDWSPSIHDVNYSEGASKEKLMAEDSKTCAEQFERMFTELWMGVRMWGEFTYLMLSPKLDMAKLGPQLTQRRMRSSGEKTRVESKKDYETRTQQGSPNEADSLTLFVHAARKGSGVTLSMKGEAVVPSSSWEDDWPHEGIENGVKVDSSNRSDYLDERMDTKTLEEFSIL